MQRGLTNGRHPVVWIVTAIAFLFQVSAAAPQTVSEPDIAEFRDRAVVMATIERRPFAMPEGDAWTGFSIELWDAIAQDLGLRYRIVESDSFDQMLGAVSTGVVHGAIANISVTEEREARLDFTLSIFDAGIQVMTPVGGGFGQVFAALLSPQLLLWVGGAIVLLFVSANLIWLAERVRSGHRAWAERGYRGGVGRGLWWALNVITQSSFDVASPETRSGRLLAAGLMVAGLFVVSAFVAQITATLTVNELRAAVTDVSDLKNQRVGTTRGSTSAAFLGENGVSAREYEDIGDMFAALEAGDLDAVVHDAPILAYYMLTEGDGRYQIPGRNLRKEKYAIALNNNSPLREAVNRSLLRLRENGTFDVIASRWFGDLY